VYVCVYIYVRPVKETERERDREESSCLCCCMCVCVCTSVCVWGNWFYPSSVCIVAWELATETVTRWNLNEILRLETINSDSFLFCRTTTQLDNIEVSAFAWKYPHWSYNDSLNITSRIMHRFLCFNLSSQILKTHESHPVSRAREGVKNASLVMGYRRFTLSIIQYNNTIVVY